AWHLIEVLKLDPQKTRRIVFHEITKNAIEEAIKSPRTVDMNLVNAQQARRILDRLVGFEISPVLWKKVQPALSAGRVQSVAVRLIVEREREIINFRPESSFKVAGIFTVGDETIKEAVLKAEAATKFSDENEAVKFLELCREAVFTVGSVSVKPGSRSPAPPFTTSTLQQEAYRKLGFSVSHTMAIAQKLYEEGKITYMRTDSTNLSSLALSKIRDVVVSEFGEKYSKIRQYKTRSKGAQEAHEAIRPTYPEKPEITGTAAEKRLYDLIWKRAIASQMADAQIEKTNVAIEMNNSPIAFNATGEVVLFDGFLKIYFESSDTEAAEDEKGILPPVKTGTQLFYNKITAVEKYTIPPPRYTEASLVKKLEELGIGRPSTYAPIISTIQHRGYVSREDRPGEKRKITLIELSDGKITSSFKTEMAGKEKSKLFPKDIGMIVNDFLIENFSDIVDYNFTAEVEEQFDRIASGILTWNRMLEEFYSPFHKTVGASLERKNKIIGSKILGTHPETGETIFVKMGKFGPVVQAGDPEKGEKPRFASLQKNQLIETITLEEALKLFSLPRPLGLFEGDEITVGQGRFGPYIKHRNKFYSLKKNTDDPYLVTLERAIEIIKEKEAADKQKVIKDYGEIKILNGRFGPYINYNRQNYRIPKSVDPEKLTEEDCQKIIDKKSKSGKE
ncbi:MAG: type I DNA topoisomerase, partial [Bacteroidales bacterium]